MREGRTGDYQKSGERRTASATRRSEGSYKKDETSHVEVDLYGRRRKKGCLYLEERRRGTTEKPEVQRSSVLGAQLQKTNPSTRESSDAVLLGERKIVL